MGISLPILHLADRGVHSFHFPIIDKEVPVMARKQSMGISRIEPGMRLLFMLTACCMLMASGCGGNNTGATAPSSGTVSPAAPTAATGEKIVLQETGDSAE